MRALVKSRPEPGLWMEDVPQPEPGAGEVLIRVRKTGICGTDLHAYAWDDWAQRNVHPPRVIGHEFVGEIVALGALVEGHRVGDRVTAEGHLTCGVCRNCRAGRRHFCPNTKGIGSGRDGAFAEYLVMPAFNLWPLDAAIPDDVAAILDPFGNAVYSASRFRRHRERARHRRRPDRPHGRGGLPLRRRAPRAGQRRQRLSPGPGPETGREPRGQCGPHPARRRPCRNWG